MAAVALANGLNANMLRRWVREAELADAAAAGSRARALVNPPAFVPVAVTDVSDRSATVAKPRETALAPALVTVEIRRGASSVSASLPMDERSAAWLREVLA